MREWREQYGDAAVVLFSVSEGGAVSVATPDTSPEPRPGDTLVGLVPADPERVDPPEGLR